MCPPPQKKKNFLFVNASHSYWTAITCLIILLFKQLNEASTMFFFPTINCGKVCPATKPSLL